MLTNNKQKYLGMRKHGRIFIGITIPATEVVMQMGSNLTGLGRLNWVQLRNRTRSTSIVIAYQCVKLRTIVGTMVMQRERYLRRYKLSRCLQEHFIRDLVHFIIKIIDEKSKVILAADVNKHSIEGKLPKETKKIGIVDSFVKRLTCLGLHLMQKEVNP